MDCREPHHQYQYRRRRQTTTTTMTTTTTTTMTTTTTTTKNQSLLFLLQVNQSHSTWLCTLLPLLLEIKVVPHELSSTDPLFNTPYSHIRLNGTAQIPITTYTTIYLLHIVLPFIGKYRYCGRTSAFGDKTHDVR